MTMMSWVPSMVAGILCGLTTVAVAKPGTKPVFDLEIDSFEQLFGAVKVLFDLPNNKYIFDINDNENPVLQLGINNGLMMAAERLLESNMSIDKVVILLRLNANQEKILRMKYGR
mgnify:CR=1 FL=1